MVLFPKTVLSILANGGGIRMTVSDALTPDTMVEYATAARKGGARLEFVVDDSVLTPETAEKVAAAGRGSVVFDFVHKSVRSARSEKTTLDQIMAER